jgi:molecular chaperone GrpE
MDGEREQTVPQGAPAGPEESTPASGKPAPEASVAPGRETELQALVEKLTAERNELKDLALRKQAEMENFRKRMQREKEEFLQHASADLVHTLLPTLDALDRALKHRSENVPEEFFQGLELIRKEFIDALGKAGLAPLDSLGQTFDPQHHHAVEMVEAGEHRDQEIVEEMQRGYRFKKRLLRPAVVKVAVAKSKPSDETK